MMEAQTIVRVEFSKQDLEEVLQKAYKDGYIKAITELKDKQLNKEWLDEATTLEMLGCKKSTLATYRSNSLLTYRGSRGAIEYSKASIEKLKNKRLAKARRL